MDKVAELLESLAAELGTTMEYLWPLLVKQTVVDWWAGALGGAIVAILCGSLAYTFWRIAAPAWESLDNDTAAIGGALGVIFSGVGCVIGLVQCITSIFNLSHLLIPEAATIERLIGALG